MLCFTFVLNDSTVAQLPWMLTWTKGGATQIFYPTLRLTPGHNLFKQTICILYLLLSVWINPAVFKGQALVRFLLVLFIFLKVCFFKCICRQSLVVLSCAKCEAFDVLPLFRDLSQNDFSRRERRRGNGQLNPHCVLNQIDFLHM